LWLYIVIIHVQKKEKRPSRFRMVASAESVHHRVITELIFGSARANAATAAQRLKRFSSCPLRRRALAKVPRQLTATLRFPSGQVLAHALLPFADQWS
jgi:hypothetical protein